MITYEEIIHYILKNPAHTKSEITDALYRGTQGTSYKEISTAVSNALIRAKRHGEIYSEWSFTDFDGTKRVYYPQTYNLPLNSKDYDEAIYKARVEGGWDKSSAMYYFPPEEYFANKFSRYANSVKYFLVNLDRWDLERADLLDLRGYLRSKNWALHKFPDAILNRYILSLIDSMGDRIEYSEEKGYVYKKKGRQ